MNVIEVGAKFVRNNLSNQRITDLLPLKSRIVGCQPWETISMNNLGVIGLFRDQVVRESF
jgi:hypothetical protein